MRVPSSYANVVPSADTSGITPLHIALANTMTGAPINASNSPILVNKAFLDTMTVYVDSGVLSPTVYESRPSTKLTFDASDLQGYSYVAEGQDVYLYRRAPDCGEDENRTEKVLIGNISSISAQLGRILFTYYGSLVRGGSAASGAGGPYGTGGLTSPYPGSDGSPYNTDTVSTSYDSFQGNTTVPYGVPGPRGGIL